MEGRAGIAILAAASNGHEIIVKAFLSRHPQLGEADIVNVIRLLKRNP